MKDYYRQIVYLLKIKMTEIIKIEKLRPLEKVFPNHLKNLTEMILDSKIIQSPIIADKKTGIVLDGSHRYVFFLKNGYKYAPVRYVDYNNENIRVGSMLIHRHLIDQKNVLTKEEIISRGLSGNLFKPRTTRHFFPFRKNEHINILLSDIEQGTPVDVSELIENVNIDFEIEHNNNYIIEIQNEIDEIIRYLEEVRQTKMYLIDQIDSMKGLK